MESTDNSPQNQAPPKKPASKTIPGIILRLILVFTAGCLVGAVIYFSASGWIPYLDQTVFEPIESNQQKVLELQATQEALESQLSSLQAALDSSQSGASSAVEATLDQFSADLGSMQSQIETNTYLAGTLSPAMIATVAAQQDSNTRFLSAVATAQMRDSGNRQEIELLRSLELMTWAHQYILHDNYGLAENELKIARENLSIMITRVPARQRVVVLEMLNLVDECLADLPSRPVIAAEKLQLAWHMGVNEFFELNSYDQSGPITPTPYLTPTPTPN